MSKSSPRRPDGIPDKLWRAYQARQQKARRADAAASLEQVEALLGRALPADLALRGWPETPDGSSFEPGADELAGFDGNAFERLLASTAEGPEPLRHWLSGCFYLDEIEGDGDCLFLALPAVSEGAAAPTAVVR